MRLINGLLDRTMVVLIVVIAVVRPAHASVNMKTFFTLQSQRYFPDTNDNNGCKDQVSKLESSYAEAAKMIYAANTAIDGIKVPKPTDFDAEQRWMVRTRALEAMFGIKIDTATGLPLSTSTDFSKDRLSEVEQIFGKMKYMMDNDNTNTPGRYPALYCGASGWKYKGLDDQDPTQTDPNVKIKDAKKPDGSQKWPNGAFWFNHNLLWTSRCKKPDPAVPNDAGQTGFCTKSTTIATTNAKNSIITFCNLGTTKRPITMPAGAPKAGDKLDDKSRVAISKTWVHELAHFYGSHPSGLQGGLPDQNAVDDQGNEIQPTKKVYGMTYVLNLAKKDPKLATHTADSYAFFAMAMLLDSLDWSENTAKDIPTAPTP